jgi:hypothetical protein
MIHHGLDDVHTQADARAGQGRSVERGARARRQPADRVKIGAVCTATPPTAWMCALLIATPFPGHTRVVTDLWQDREHALLSVPSRHHGGTIESPTPHLVGCFCAPGLTSTTCGGGRPAHSTHLFCGCDLELLQATLRIVCACARHNFHHYAVSKHELCANHARARRCLRGTTHREGLMGVRARVRA